MGEQVQCADRQAGIGTGYTIQVQGAGAGYRNRVEIYMQVTGYRIQVTHTGFRLQVTDYRYGVQVQIQI